MAGTIFPKGAVTGAVVQAVAQAKQVFRDPLKATLSDNVEEIHDALNEAVRVLGLVRKDFETEVKQNKMRVPSRIYVEWIQRVIEIDGQFQDLIAEYIKQTKEETSFWFLSPRPYFREQMKKMHEKVINLAQEIQDLRKLLSNNNCDLMEIPQLFFDNMSLLVFLDLSHTSIKSLPPSISRLVSLQTFNLRGCELLNELPPQTGALRKLEVFDLEGTEIMYLPREICKLISLRCFKISLCGHANTYGETKQTSIAIPAEVLSIFSQLEELSIEVSPDGEWWDDDVNPASEWWDADVKAVLNALSSSNKLRILKLYLPSVELLQQLRLESKKLVFPNLSEFRFIVGPHQQRIIYRLPNGVEERFNKWEKEFKKCLKYINGKGMPSGITEALKHVSVLLLDRHWTVKVLSEFGHENLANLQCCLLVECNELQTIVDGDYECSSGGCKKPIFEWLHHLSIHYMKSLESIWQGSIDKYSLFNLKSLTLHTCPNLTTVFTPDMLGNLGLLEELIVEDCPKIRSIVTQEYANMKSGSFLRCLRKIALLDLPQLVTISGPLCLGEEVGSLFVYNCPMLESLYTMERFPNYYKIVGEKEWWDSLKWHNSEWSRMTQPAFEELKTDEDFMDQLEKDIYSNPEWSRMTQPSFEELIMDEESMYLHGMHEKVNNLLQKTKEIKELVNCAVEPIVKRKGPDIRDYGTLRKPLEKILDWLKRCDVKGIGIHGTVGIGKTTVMLNLNNDDQVAKMFDIVIWLTVSKEGGKENLRREHLQHAIAQRLKLTMAGTNNADEVALRIFTELKGKKYLLLLDDVKQYLNLSEVGIPYSNNGSKIVLTTRLRPVCKLMADKAIKVAYLSPDEAWKMFQDVLGSKILLEGQRTGPLAWKLCKECSGLPLLIEKVANTFKSKNSESLWSDGLNSWMMWPIQESKGIREVYDLIRFCYNDLGDERSKKCFLYVALYPQDSEINIDSLLECWAAEDLLGCGYGNDTRKVRIMMGNFILTRLKNVSLLEEGKSDYHVTMHKFIRQVALYISKDRPECKHLVETNKELTEPPDEESWGEKNRISLGDNELDRLPDSPNCSMLSSLFLQKNLCLERIPPAFFEHMINLRVLNLSHTGITSLPSSLSILISLKVLDLNNCKQLMELPSHIVELVQLESLDIHGSGITYIPPHIEKLIFLKRLWVSFENGNDTQGVNFNDNMISKLCRLEELVVDVKSPEQWTNEVVENMMKEVAKLKKFKRLKVCFSNWVVDVIEVAPMSVRILVPESRFLLSYIRRSSWRVVRKIGPFRFFIGCRNSEFCQKPNFVIYDKYVKYCNGAGSNTPILEVLAEAEGFELVNHKDIKQLSDFGTANMNKIQGCLIEGCDAIETIMDTVGSELLPNLEQLFVKNLPMLRSIWKEGPLQTGSLTKLTTLVLSNCRILDKVFPPGVIQKLCEIRCLKVEKCNQIEEIIPEADANGKLPILPKLHALILLDMTKLSSICATESLKWPSLERLEIINCPGLSRLPFNNGNSANLELIIAEQEWWEALEWQNQKDKEVLQKLCIFSSDNAPMKLYEDMMVRKRF